MNSETEMGFIVAFNEVADDVAKTARDKGWTEEREQLILAAHAVSPELGMFATKVIAGSMIALEHSELSEGLQGIRGDLKDDHLPEFTMEEVEAADTIIRIMNRAVDRNLDVAEALVAKLRYNKSRPHKHGGKGL